ncbi:MAG: L,D-transpeptidase family protein [Lepagella sp.]
MRNCKSTCFVAFFFGLILLSSSCSGGGNTSSSDTTDGSVVADSVATQKELAPGDEGYEFKNADEIGDYLENGKDSDKYTDGILPVIVEHAPQYAEKLFKAFEKFSKFLVVDKASMRVILYDSFGMVIKAYDMACAKNFGTKHKKADSRTPEGFFSVEGIYDSTDWLFTDDNGHTSKKKGQFGPRFIRIKNPVTSQIGIHGTCSPWSIGSRASHGCIRITNEQILELVKLVEPGMPVIILPGKRDRAVNRDEGYDITYFPTDPKYAMTAKEKSLKVNSEKKDFSEKKDSVDNSTVPVDTVATSPQPVVETPAPETVVTDSI